MRISPQFKKPSSQEVHWKHLFFGGTGSDRWVAEPCLGGLTHLPRGQPHAGEPCGEARLLRVWRRLRGGGFNVCLGPTLVRNGYTRLGTPEGYLLCAVLRWHILALCAAEPSPQALLELPRPLYTWERGTQRLIQVSRVSQGHGRVRGEAIDPWDTPPCFPTPLLTLTPQGAPALDMP